MPVPLEYDGAEGSSKSLPVLEDSKRLENL